MNVDLLETFGDDYYPGDLALLAGDLVVENADLAAIDWAENIRLAVLRRLNTPVGAIATTCLTVDGLVVLNATYGNPAMRYLSEPLHPGTVSLIRQGVIDCLNEEDRIELVDVGSRLEPYPQGVMLVFDLVYTIRETGEQVNLAVAANSQTLSFDEV